MFDLVSKDSCRINKLEHIQQISGNIEHQDLISAFLRSLGDTSVLSETLFSLHLQRCSQLKRVRLWRKKTVVKEMSLCERRVRIAAGWDASRNYAFVICSSMWSVESVSSLNPLIKPRLDPTNQTPSDSSMFSKVNYIVSVNLTHSHHIFLPCSFEIKARAQCTESGLIKRGAAEPRDSAVGSSLEPLTLLQPAEASSGLACCVTSALQLMEAAEKPQCWANKVYKVQSTNSVPVARKYASGSHKQSASSAAGNYMNDLELHLQKHVSCRQLKAQIGSVDLTEARVAGSYGRADGGQQREQLSPRLLAPQNVAKWDSGQDVVTRGGRNPVSRSPRSAFPKSSISAFK